MEIRHFDLGDPEVFARFERLYLYEDEEMWPDASLAPEPAEPDTEDLILVTSGLLR